MLEMFFDNEKVFSVFEQIIKQDSEKICFPRICFNLKIEPAEAVDILHSFLFLDILKETEDSKEEGLFLLNRESVVVLGLCFFDDIVGKYTLQKISKDFGDIANVTNDGEEIDVEEISFEDFLNDILGDGL